MATLPKGHAKVPALAPGATCLEGDVSSSSCMGEGLRGVRVPLATRSTGRGQPTGPQDSSWLSLSQAVAGVHSSLSGRRDVVAAPALCLLSLPTVYVEDIAPCSSHCGRTQCRPRSANEASVLESDSGRMRWDSFLASLIARLSQWALLKLLHFK